MLVAVVAAFAVVAAVAWALFPQTYTATAQHTVEPITALSSGSSFNTVNMETERLVATSAAVLERAAETLGEESGASVAALSDATVVQVPRGSQVLTFDVTTSSPEQSAEWANAVASAYGAHRSDNARAVVEQTTAELGASIQRLQSVYDAQPADSDARQATQLQLDALLEEQARLQATSFFPGTLVTPATVVTESNRPGNFVFVIGGLFLGLIVGSIAALVVSRSRRGHAVAYRRDLDTERGITGADGEAEAPPSGETPAVGRPDEVSTAPGVSSGRGFGKSPPVAVRDAGA